MSKNFTTSFLNNIKHTGKIEIIRDAKTTGLAIRVGARTKSFEFYYKINGKLKRVGIGRYPAVSLVEARKQVASYRILLDKGLPLDYEDISKKTFQQLYDEWSRMKSRTIKDSQRHIDGLMKNHLLPSLADYKLSDLTPAILLKPIERRITQGKTGVAAIALGKTKEMLTYGVRKGYLSTNPLSSVTIKTLGLKKATRDYVIPLDDLKLIYNCDINSLVVPMIKLMALTFLRNNEIRLLKWSYIDWENKKLNLPKEVMKNGKSFDVHLTSSALEILIERAELREEQIEYVFFSSYKNKPLDRTFVPIRYKDIQRATGTTGWKGHDMRRNVSHLVENTDVDVTTADSLLSHTLSGVQGIYQRSKLWEERKEALVKWEDFLKEEEIIAD